MVHGSFSSLGVLCALPFKFIELLWGGVWGWVFETPTLFLFGGPRALGGGGVGLGVPRSDCTDQRQRASERGE